jgi:hypothetical protein
MKNWYREIALVVSAILLVLYVHNFELFELSAEELDIVLEPIIVNPDEKTN